MKTSRENTQSTRKQASLRVPKESAEKAIRTLTNNSLIDRDHRIESSKKHVFIPLTGELSTPQIQSLKNQLGILSLAQHTFHQEPKRPRSLKQALQGRIPPQLLTTLPSSYDIIGDIAVLDLTPTLSDYETLIAEGIREVNKNVRVVLAKAGAVSGQERILPTRHVSGENRTVTIHRESGCRFKVDISKAFFSPRLSHEHERVAGQVEPGEVVTDLFAGVGPFSIMITKRLRDVEVNAIDANPDAVSLLRENQALNKVQGKLNVWLDNARDAVKRGLSRKATRVIMNNPSAADQFVDVACTALRTEGGIMHYYTFAEGSDCEDKAVEELERALEKCNWRVRWLAQARRVRGVSPMKWQIAVDAPVSPIS